ncbi:hypothetical protein L3X07_08475 [Levilactobacillus brevis]|nr:hypothetical protein [Levilactobacillus brevis]
MILLHAYSGSSNDMRLLARRLQSENYTVLAPIFSGHATGDPADILRQGSPQQWWQDTQTAIANLRRLRLPTDCHLWVVFGRPLCDAGFDG